MRTTSGHSPCLNGVIILFLLFGASCSPLEMTDPGSAGGQGTPISTSVSDPVASSQTETTRRTPTASATMTPTITSTPTVTATPTITDTPSITPSPTFDFPDVVVNQPLAACLFGPTKAYLWARDLKQGDTGVVWGRAPYGSSWLYVKMDGLDIPCWVSPFVVDVSGDPKTVIVETIRLPVTNALYSPPENVIAARDGSQVTVSWDEVWMTEDDDRGYFLELWLCQAGNYLWVPVSLPDQYQTQIVLTDEPGCGEASRGEIRTVEKHGYTDAVQIEWPAP